MTKSCGACDGCIRFRRFNRMLAGSYYGPTSQPENMKCERTEVDIQSRLTSLETKMNKVIEMLDLFTQATTRNHVEVGFLKEVVHKDLYDTLKEEYDSMIKSHQNQTDKLCKARLKK